MLFFIDLKSLGKRQSKPVHTTRVIIQCDYCHENQWETIYGYHRERKQDICRSCQNSLGISGMKGKHHSEEFKKRRSDEMSGENNPAKRLESRIKIKESCKHRDMAYFRGKKRPNHSKKMSEYMTEVWSSENPQRDKYLSSMENRQKKSIYKNETGQFHSILHTRIKERLIKEGFMNFESEVRVDRYIVDEIDEYNKIIIEINGDYWHCNPNKYSENFIHPTIKKEAREIWERDTQKIQTLEKLGYNVLTIWQSEWENNKEKIVNHIKEIYNGL